MLTCFLLMTLNWLYPDRPVKRRSFILDGKDERATRSCCCRSIHCQLWCNLLFSSVLHYWHVWRSSRSTTLKSIGDKAQVNGPNEGAARVENWNKVLLDAGITKDIHHNPKSDSSHPSRRQVLPNLMEPVVETPLSISNQRGGKKDACKARTK